MKKYLLFASSFFLSTVTFGQDYWNKIPAPPTACYSEQDDYLKKLDGVREEVKNEIVNRTAAMKAQAQNMTQEDRMKLATQYQTMTPDQIVKMQAEQSELATLQQTVAANGTTVENKFNELVDQYHEDFKTRLNPIWEEYGKLPDGEGTPDWAIKKGQEIIAQYNKEYEALCNKYFSGSSSLFTPWLVDYKKYLTETEVPFYSRYSAIQYRSIGITPDPGIADLDAVEKYMERLRAIYELRSPHAQGQ